MAASTLATFYNVTTAAASQVSPSFTPAANDLIVVWVHVQKNTDLTGVTMTTSAPGESFTKVISGIHDTINACHLFVSNSAAAATARTVTFNGGVIPDGLWYAVYRISGMTRYGLDAIRTVGGFQQVNGISGPTGVNPITCSFTNNCDAANPVHFHLTQPATQRTFDAAWTMQNNLSYSSPTARNAWWQRDSGFTGNTINGVGTTGASIEFYRITIVEFDTSPLVTGPIANLTETEDKDTILADATAEVAATMVKADANDTISASSINGRNASLDEVENNDSISAAAGLAPAGATLDDIEAPDVIGSDASAAVKADLNKAEAKDSISGSAGSDIVANLSKTETNDPLSSNASVQVDQSNATLSALEAKDVLTSKVVSSANLGIWGQTRWGSSVWGTGDPTGELDDTEAPDRLSSSLTVASTASLNKTEASDTTTTNVGVAENADLSKTEGNDALSSGVSVEAGASLSKTEANDALSSNVLAAIAASLSKTEDKDTVLADAGALTLANLSKNEVPDSINSSSSGEVGAAATIPERFDTLSSGVLVAAAATLDKTEDNDSLSSIVTGGAPLITATLDEIEDKDVLSASVGVEAGATLSKTEALDTLASNVTHAVAGAALDLTERSDGLTASASSTVQASMIKADDSDTIASLTLSRVIKRVSVFS